MPYGSNLLLNGNAATGTTIDWTADRVYVLTGAESKYFSLGANSSMLQNFSCVDFILQPVDFKLTLKSKFSGSPWLITEDTQAYAKVTFNYFDNEDSFISPLYQQFADTVTDADGTWSLFEEVYPTSNEKVLISVDVSIVTNSLTIDCHVKAISCSRNVADLEVHDTTDSPHQLPLSITVNQQGIKGVKGEVVKFWLHDDGDADFGGKLTAATGIIGTKVGRQLIVDEYGQVTIPALTLLGLDDHPTITSISNRVTATEEGIETANSLIEQTEHEIRMSVTSEIASAKEEAISSASAALSITAAQIRAEVSDKEFDLQGRINASTSSWQIEAGLIRSVVSSSFSDVDGEIDSLSSTIEQTAGSIWLRVSDSNKGNTLASEINMTSTSIKIAASKVDIEGAVTFSSLDSTLSSAVSAGRISKEIVDDWCQSGTTLIDGANIYTGTITADKIATGALYIGAGGIVTLGADAKIQWSNLLDAQGHPIVTPERIGAATVADIPTAEEVAAWVGHIPSTDEIFNLTHTVINTQITENTIWTGKINANSVLSGTLTGVIINHVNYSGNKSGFCTEPTFGDAEFYHNGSLLAKIINDISGITIRAEAGNHLRLGDSGHGVSGLYGVWDLSNATITWPSNMPSGGGGYAVFS